MQKRFLSILLALCLILLIPAAGLGEFQSAPEGVSTETPAELPTDTPVEAPEEISEETPAELPADTPEETEPAAPVTTKSTESGGLYPDRYYLCFNGIPSHSYRFTKKSGSYQLTLSYNGSFQAFTILKKAGGTFDRDYELGSSGSGTITIGKTMTLKADGSALSFPQGTQNGKFTLKVTSQTQHVTYEYYSGSKKLSGVPTKAGKYTVKAIFAATKNYKECSATATFTITKAGK